MHAPLESALVWFRRDLRLDDNPALQAALRAHERLLPVYIHAPDEAAPWQPGAPGRGRHAHSRSRGAGPSPAPPYSSALGGPPRRAKGEGIGGPILTPPPASKHQVQQQRSDLSPPLHCPDPLDQAFKIRIHGKGV